MQVVEVRVLSWAPEVVELRSGNPRLISESVAQIQIGLISFRPIMLIKPH
jgi:hypothetical protein